MIDLHYGDCFNFLPNLKPDKIDLIIADMPYGTTRCKWDTCINLQELWRVLPRKKDTAILLFAQTPFDKVLGSSNIEELKYEWIWQKTAATGHLNAKKMPMKAHENILVFYKSLPVYNPQFTYNHKPVNSYTKHQNDGECYGETKTGISGGGSTRRYPRSVQTFKSDKQKESLHPTQKPIELLEYLIKTYSNKGDTVLDFCMGSGSTGIAALNCERNFIGIEKDINYFKVASKRIRSLS